MQDGRREALVAELRKELTDRGLAWGDLVECQGLAPRFLVGGRAKGMLMEFNGCFLVVSFVIIVLDMEITKCMASTTSYFVWRFVARRSRIFCCDFGHALGLACQTFAGFYVLSIGGLR